MEKKWRMSDTQWRKMKNQMKKKWRIKWRKNEDCQIPREEKMKNVRYPMKKKWRIKWRKNEETMNKKNKSCTPVWGYGFLISLSIRSGREKKLEGFVSPTTLLQDWGGITFHNGNRGSLLGKGGNTSTNHELFGLPPSRCWWMELMPGVDHVTFQRCRILSKSPHNLKTSYPSRFDAW